MNSSEKSASLTNSRANRGLNTPLIVWEWFHRWFKQAGKTDTARKPHKIDAIVLEDRILYSATPLLAFIDPDNPSLGNAVDPDVLGTVDLIIASISDLPSSGDIGPSPPTVSDVPFDSINLVDSDSKVDNALANTVAESDSLKALATSATHATGSIGDPDEQFAMLAPFEVNELLHQVADDRSFDIIVLNRLESSFEQVDRLLQEYHDLDAIHIVAQSTDGMIQFQPLGTVQDVVSLVDLSIDVVLVDSQLQDSLTLQQAVDANAQLFVFDSATDSAHDVLRRVSDWMANHGGKIESLSILSHGAEGGFELGHDWITRASLPQFAADWHSVTEYFVTNANIYVFGCNVSSNADGQILLDDLATLTSSVVFASTNVTGVGGDWILESRSDGSRSVDASGIVIPIDIELLEASDASLAWYNSSWSYRKQITIDYTKVSATQTNFAVLVNLASDTDLQSNALANADDLVFTAADGVTQLDYEISSYSAANGQLVAWVRIPSLSASANTVVYLYYGNAAATNQQNVTGVYDSSTVAVYHLNESAGPYVDVTTHQNNSTTGTAPTKVAGQVGSGEGFDGSTNDIGIPDAAVLDVTNNATISAWFKLNATGQADILEKGGNNGYVLWLDGNKIAFGSQNTAVAAFAYTSTTFSTGVWYKIDGVNNAGTKSVYVDGVLDGTSSSSNSFSNTGVLKIGNGLDGFFNGTIDEVNIDNTARSASWIATEYNNQKTPSTFYALAAQEVLNHAPAGTDKTVSGTEDTTYTFVTSDFGFTDPNDSPANSLSTVTISTLPGLGTLTLSGAAVTAGQSVSVANINAGLLVYNPVANANGTNYSNFTFQIQDDGGTANGGIDLDAAPNTITFNITAVNDAPVRTAGSVNSLTVNEDSGLTSLGFASVDYGTGGGTDEAGQTLTYKVITIPSSALFGQVVLADGTTAAVAGNFYTLTEIRGLQLKTTQDKSGVSFFSYQAFDNGGTANGGVDTVGEAIMLTITAVNDAAVVTTTGSASAYTENTAATVIDSGLTVTDVDTTNMTGATVSISSNYANGQDVLAFTNQLGVTGSWNSSTGQLTLSGTTTKANYQTALRSITYVNSSDDPSTATRTVSFIVNDGTVNSLAATRDISVTAVNDAPILDNTGTMTLTTITEDQTTSSGNTVASIIASASGDRITDLDSGAVEGIAIAALTNGNGIWEYSTNSGSSWNAIGTVSSSSALLLRSSDLVRFVPNGITSTSGTITFYAWDQSSGTFGTKVDASTNGGTTAFSTAVEVASINITAVNDAPVLDNTGTMTLTTIMEDQTTSSGDAIGTIILSASGDRVTDPDFAFAFEGIAITGIVSGNGTWQYTTDGTNWFAAGSVSDSSALLLRDTDRLRFIPDGNNSDSASITFRAWDQTSGTQGTKVDASTNGGTTAFSTAVEVASISVTAVNDAPVLADTALSITVTEDAGAPSGTVGSLISAFTGGITDVDNGAIKGIAITASVETNGTWYYTTNNGSTWTAVGTVNATSSLLLADNANTRLSFAPGADYNGTSSSALTIRGWDQTSGSAGTKVSTSTNGTTTAFSSATDVVDVLVSVVNDAPVRTAGSVNNLTVNEDSGLTSLGLGNVAYGTGGGADEAGQALTYKVITIPSSASFGQVVLADGTTAAVVGNSYTLVEIRGMQLKTTQDKSGVSFFSYQVIDNGGTANGGVDTIAESIMLTINAVNDAAVVTTTGSTLAYTENAAATAIDPAVTVTDVDSANMTGAIVTISANYVNGQDVLAFTNQLGITGSWNSSTGQLTLSGTTTKANYQTALRSITYDNSSDDPSTATRTVSFVVNDGAVNSTAATRNVSITAVNDEQVLAANTGLTIAENATGTTISNTLFLTSDVDNTASQLVYTVTSITINGTLRQSGTALALNSIFTQADINSGLITYDHNGSETTSDSFTFGVDDGAGTASTGTFNFTITPVNDNAPLITSNGAGATASINVAENTTAVTTVVATDADLSGQTVTYSIIGGGDSSLFAINSSTGVITFVSGRNRESHTDADLNGIYDLIVEASDGTLTDTQAINVTITDVDEFDVGAVTDSNAGANTVAENAANGTTVGIIAAANDADATTNTVTYSLFDSDGGNFAIDTNTGMVTTAAALNREALGASRNITVRATSADGSTADTVFTININDLDEFDTSAISDLNNATNSVAENPTNGAVVGVAAFATDADATTNAITYSLDDDAGGRFTIDTLTGIVTVSDGTMLDYETAISHSITVRASSTDGSSSSQSFIINLVDVNEFAIGSVSDSDSAVNAVLENAAIGTTVGISGRAIDLDGTATVIYSLVDDASGRFAIDANTGLVTVAGAIDREAASSYDITIRATSSDSSFTLQSFSIAVGDVDEFDVSAIIDVNMLPDHVAENVANGTLVGVVAMASDGDATLSRVVYSLDNSANGRFAIDSLTGAIRVADGTLLNFEAAPSHSIIIRATSDDGSSTTLAVSIAIADVNEKPVGASDSYSTRFIDNLVVNIPGVLANDSDPDGNSLNVVLVSGPSVGVLVLQSDGSFSYAPAPNFVGSVTFAYQVTDGALSSDVIIATINVTVPNNIPGGGTGSGGSGSGGGGSGVPSPSDETNPPANNSPQTKVGFVSTESAGTQATDTNLRTEAQTLPQLVAERNDKDDQQVSNSDSADGITFKRNEHGYDFATHESITRQSHEGANRRFRRGNEEQSRQELLTMEPIEFEDNTSYFGISEAVVQSVLGTGLVIWMMQGAQLLATIIAATPAWIHLDPISVLPKASDDDSDDKVEAGEVANGEKLFDDIKRV